MIRLEATVKRYIADEGDTKPRPGLTIDGHLWTATDLPAGSSLLIRDSGDIWRWDGAYWGKRPDEENDSAMLGAILMELQDTREEARTGLPVVRRGLPVG